MPTSVPLKRVVKTHFEMRRSGPKHALKEGSWHMTISSLVGWKNIKIVAVSPTGDPPGEPSQPVRPLLFVTSSVMR